MNKANAAAIRQQAAPCCPTLCGPADTDSAIMKAWEDFVSGCELDKLPVRDVVARSWNRCQNLLVDVRASAAPLLGVEQVHLLRRDNRDLLQAAAPTLAEAADLLAGTRTLMLIADASGVVLDAVGDPATLAAGRDICLGGGGNWSESCAGTNGIGTALASKQPVVVHAAEHYCEGIKGWSCAGAPIHDPVDGSVIGLLDISGLKHASSNQALALAALTARQVEWNLARQTEAEHMRLLEACLEDSHKYAGEGLIALDAKGRLLYVSRKASQLLRSRFGPDIPELKRGARIASLQAFETGEPADDRPLPHLPVDWIKPLLLDGERRGSLLVIPGATSTRVPARSRMVPDESDSARSNFGCIVGGSDSMATVIGQAERLAPLHVPVLIEGETGVGKELFARAIHGRSTASAGPFVPFNCGAVSREMLASELFGYVRGAFTGASSEGRIGRFELADGGTLCLDEIGELPLDLQPYLLRVLEEGVLYRVGDNTPRRVTVRLLAMTNRNLREEVAAGRFRRDLYHRLSVTALRVPPLRERHGDVERLVRHFNALLAERHGRPAVHFPGPVLDRLNRYDWPGNVRELKNLVERVILLSTTGTADPDDLPEELRSGMALPPPADSAASPRSLTTTEQRTIEEVVVATGGNLSDAAVILGISRSTLYRKMSQYGIRRAAANGPRPEGLKIGHGFGRA